MVRFANAEDSWGSRSSSHIRDSNPLIWSRPSTDCGATMWRLTRDAPDAAPVGRRPCGSGEESERSAEQESRDDVAPVVDPDVESRLHDTSPARPHHSGATPRSRDNSVAEHAAADACPLGNDEVRGTRRSWG